MKGDYRMRHLTKWMVGGMAALTLLLSGCGKQAQQSTTNNQSSQKTEQNDKQHQKTNGRIDWRKPSENKPYPKMDSNLNRWLKVSLKDKRVYVMSNDNKVLYTMYASSGSKNSTPTGTFNIQAERGNFFYNASSKEGARYWTSFKDHGVYLFHTVPTNQQGQYDKSQAEQLGKSANSHGCIRLSVPDAKWINQNVPFNTKVVIH